jgi:hypothetical protein
VGNQSVLTNEGIVRRGRASQREYVECRNGKTTWLPKTPYARNPLILPSDDGKVVFSC